MCYPTAYFKLDTNPCIKDDFVNIFGHVIFRDSEFTVLPVSNSFRFTALCIVNKFNNNIIYLL